MKKTSISRNASLRRSAVLAVAFGSAIAVAAGSGSASARSSSTKASSHGTSLATFKQRLAAAEKTEPNHWEGPTVPVKPPKHFKVAGITCFSELEGCLTPIQGAADAAKALGWQFQIYDGQDDPTVQANRIQQAIQNHVNAIILAAVDGDAVKTAIQQAQKAGIIVISTSNGTAPGQQGLKVDTSPNVTGIGKAVADWMIVNSRGKGVVAPFVDKEFQTNLDFADGINNELAQCSGCTVKPEVSFVGTDVASKLGPNTTAYLQKNPDVKYFYSTYDPAMVSQTEAVSQAGINVQSCSQLGDAQNLSFIKSGHVQSCDGAWDNEYEGYATIDQIIRIADHKPLWVSHNVPARYKYGENIPWVLLDKTNLPTSDQTYRASFDYIDKYKKLWGLK